MTATNTRALLLDVQGAAFAIASDTGGVLDALKTQATVDARSDAHLDRARQRAASLARVYPDAAGELHLIVGDICLGLELDALEDDHRADALRCAGRARTWAQRLAGWVDAYFGVRGAGETRERMAS